MKAHRVVWSEKDAWAGGADDDVRNLHVLLEQRAQSIQFGGIQGEDECLSRGHCSIERRRIPVDA